MYSVVWSLHRVMLHLPPSFRLLCGNGTAWCARNHTAPRAVRGLGPMRCLHPGCLQSQILNSAACLASRSKHFVSIILQGRPSCNGTCLSTSAWMQPPSLFPRTRRTTTETHAWLQQGLPGFTPSALPNKGRNTVACDLMASGWRGARGRGLRQLLAAGWVRAPEVDPGTFKGAAPHLARGRGRAGAGWLELGQQVAAGGDGRREQQRRAGAAWGRPWRVRSRRAARERLRLATPLLPPQHG